jgi:hypothetical protein
VSLQSSAGSTAEPHAPPGTGLPPAPIPIASIPITPDAALVPPALLEPPWRSESRGMFRDLAGLLLDRHLRRPSRLRAPVEWRLARILERLDRGSGYLDLGFARLSDYATERLGLTARRVQTLVTLARRLAALPRVAAACESGDLSQTQAALVARVATAGDEERWVARATALTVRRLTLEVREALAARAAGVAGVAGAAGAALAGLAERPPSPAAALSSDLSSEEDEPGEMVTFSAPARLRPLWEEALELARRTSGAAEPVHRCVEFIAADFLAGAPDLPRLLAEAVADQEPAAAGFAPDGIPQETCAPGTSKDDGTDAEGTDLFEEILRALEQEAGATLDRADAAEGLGPAAVGEAAAGSEVVLSEEAADRPDDTPRVLDQRLRTLVALRQNLAWHQGRLLRILATRRLYRDLGFLSFHRYCVERAGLGARRAWQLIALDRRLTCLPRLATAYRAGEISWVRASAVARVATEVTEADWIRLAALVTVRRLHEEIAFAAAADEAAMSEGVQPGGIVSGIVGSGGVRPPGLGLDGRVQLSAPRAATASRNRGRDGGEGGEAREGHEFHGSGERRAHIRFWAPLETASLWRRAVAVSRVLLLRERDGLRESGKDEPTEPAEWECVERIVQTFVVGWSVRQTAAWQRRYRIFERDGWRCRVPGCSSRSNLQVHHVVFRSQGGGDDDGNLAVLCATHHLRGIHQGRLRAHALPGGLLAWEFAPDPAAGALIRYVEDVTWDAARA